MNAKIKVGIFSPNDARPWVRASNVGAILHSERMLIEALEKQGVEVVRGGEGLPREDEIAWNTALVRTHIRHIAAQSPDALILHQGDWTWPYDSRDAALLFADGIGGVHHGMARLLLYCHKDTKVPGLVAGMAAGGALRRIGMAYRLVYGKLDEDPSVIGRIMDTLRFYGKRAESAQTVIRAVEGLKRQKYLALGGMSLKMCTATADVDQWSKLFGISYDAFDQSELTDRACAMVEWSGSPGKSEAVRILDPRVGRALDYLYREGHGRFDFSRDKLPSVGIFIHQLSYYYAACDLLAEQGGTFMGIKCQDELSGKQCTQCVAAAFLNNDVAPDGSPRAPVPVACENDMDSSLTQLFLHLLNGGKPAGFGDFRDIEDRVLAVVNCGQHPPYFFGGPDEDSREKLDRAEYMGQEIWYNAGGASVRGRTPGGHAMTFARLHRENLRYSIAAMAVRTVDCDAGIHEKYSASWPVILARTPIGDSEVVRLWPCNHLGFSYGDLTAPLAEMAERLGIGYRIYDMDGNEYFKES